MNMMTRAKHISDSAIMKILCRHISRLSVTDRGCESSSQLPSADCTNICIIGKT